MDTGSYERNQVSGRVRAFHLVKKAKSRRFVWDCIIGGDGDRTRIPSAASRAGDETRTRDIQLGSNRFLFEFVMSAKSSWIVIFAILFAGCDLVETRTHRSPTSVDKTPLLIQTDSDESRSAQW